MQLSRSYNRASTYVNPVHFTFVGFPHPPRAGKDQQRMRYYGKKLCTLGFQDFAAGYMQPETGPRTSCESRYREVEVSGNLRAVWKNAVSLQKFEGGVQGEGRASSLVVGPPNHHYLSLIINSPMSFSTFRLESSRTILPVSISTQNTRLS